MLHVGEYTALKAPAQDELGLANLAVQPGAKAAASSVYADGALPMHQIAHLNDGLGGNDHSWISKGEPSWAEVDLGDAYSVCHVAFGSDSSRKYDDRAVTSFTILTATKYDKDSGAPDWHQAFRQTEGTPVHVRTDFWFRPVTARWVRIAIAAASGGEARIDEFEVYGQKDAIAPGKVASLLAAGTTSRETYEAQLKYAFLGEEHAWLKIFGWADLDPALVPYNGRVKEYPRHVEDDSLPLPPLPSVPMLDGKLDDACWEGASAGCVRVAYPYDFERGPLVEQTVMAGWQGRDLYLGLRMSQLLSSHLAVVSSADWGGCGVVALTRDGLVFNTYTREGEDQGKLDKTIPLQGRYDPVSGCCELKLPLELFPRCQEIGLRVGLGLGGTHTPAVGRAVNFSFAALGVAAEPASGGAFPVRLSAPVGGDAVTMHAAAPGLDEDIALKPGETKRIAVRAEDSGLGPKCDLKLRDGNNRYALHLFRYDPTGRTLTQMAELAQRMAAKGLDVSAEKASLAGLQTQHERLLGAGVPDLRAERKVLYEARLAKRDLFYCDPDLAPLQRLLFVKRQPFLPSHIYTDLTDAPFRPGGAVCRLDVPHEGGRLTPGKALATALFQSQGGVARDPAAACDLSRIYFGYRPAADGFYHIMSMKADGSDLKQLTDGPYHDFYPCPLPDGDVAFITTRCTCRVFCFRPGSYVLHRMKSDGSDLRRLSLASLSEWAPSVMTDGRIIWTRWEYVDKGADFSQTLWSIHPDGTHPEMVFGNDIIQPNGYACGREVPGTQEILCTLVSHFGDINGPLALLDLGKGRSNPQAITSVTPEVPWPGMWPSTECFRDPVPISRDLFLCAHAPRDRFGLYVVDRFGNRELLYMDDTISSMSPTVLRAVAPPPVVAEEAPGSTAKQGAFVMMDVNRGLEPTVKRGSVKWLRVVEEVRHNISDAPNRDYADFMKFYASPVDIVYGPFGWPAYVAKASLGLVPVGADGSASFSAPAGKTVYFEALDGDFNEMQRMRSVVHLQPGERRTCVGCHDPRNTAPPVMRSAAALGGQLQQIQPPSWGDAPFSYERVVQPVLDANCAKCHTAQHSKRLDLTGRLDADKVPASYRTLITRGLVNYLDCGWNSAGCELRAPLTFGTLKSKLWTVLDAGHHGVVLTEDERLRIKTWTDLNCPLWPDYIERGKRSG